MDDELEKLFANSISNRQRRTERSTESSRPETSEQPEKVYKLTLLGEKRRAKWGQMEYLCRCDCGQKTWVKYQKLYYGTAKSCGCSTWHKHPAVQLEEQKIGKLKVLHWESWEGVWTAVCEECGALVEARRVAELRRMGVEDCGEHAHPALARARGAVG